MILLVAGLSEYNHEEDNNIRRYCLPFFRPWECSMSECIIRIVFKSHTSCWIPFSMLFGKTLKYTTAQNVTCGQLMDAFTMRMYKILSSSWQNTEMRLTIRHGFHPHQVHMIIFILLYIYSKTHLTMATQTKFFTSQPIRKQ